jgi:hypothetical protein
MTTTVFFLPATVASAGRALVSGHPDTASISRCFSPADELPFSSRLFLASQRVTLPTVCLDGDVNLCTQDVNMSASVGGGAPIQIVVGDGTAAPTLGSGAVPWVTLPDNVFPGTPCDGSSLRLRDAVVAARGLYACLDLRISCLSQFGFDDVELPCIDLGDDTSRCAATDRCSCIEHPECGW